MPLRVSRVAPRGPVFRSPVPARKATILIAEDSADSREMLQILLQIKGYAVALAGDGFEAVDVAVHEIPDLMLMDLDLPGLDGLAVAKELRLHRELSSMPIIMISGYDPLHYREAAINAGCDEYLTKPIDFERLDRILLDRVPAHFRHPGLA